MILFLEQSNSINWWAIAGSVASVLAAVVAVITVWFQKYKYDKERKPIISPLVKRFELGDVGLLSDWESGNKIDKKWAEVTVRLKNFGNEPLIDMDYSYVFKNYNAVEEHLKRRDSAVAPFLELHNPQFKKYKKETILSEASLRGSNGEMEFDYSIKRILLNGDPISPGGEVEISLPSYFIIVANYLLTLKNSSFLHKFDAPFPVLELYIHGKDTDQRKWLIVYEIFFDSRMKSTIGSADNRFSISLSSNHVLTKKLKNKR